MEKDVPAKNCGTCLMWNMVTERCGEEKRLKKLGRVKKA